LLCFSQEVCSSYLALGYARRLLWEVCRLVQSADWASLFANEIAPTDTGIFHNQAPDAYDHILAQAGQRYLECKKRVEVEYDLNILREQSDAVHALLVADRSYGVQGAARSAAAALDPSTRSTPIPMIDLAPFHQFRRLAEKRAATFERYFCVNAGCGMDFTRVDALMRHSRICQVGRKGKKGKSQPMEHDSDLDSMDNESEDAIEDEFNHEEEYE